MKKMKHYSICFGIFLTIGLMLGVGCDSGASDGGCDTQNSVFEGDFTIKGLDDLAALSGYTEITGTLTISDTDLRNINGLESLSIIGGSFFIYNNSVLTNLNGLCRLTTIGGDLEIRENSALVSLSGLSKLTKVENWLTIESNPSIRNLHGLDSLTTIRYLGIIDNTLLLNIDGLGKLAKIEESIDIISNPLLRNLHGLGSLTTAGYLSIIDNALLLNIDGLEKLTHITGALFIAFNQLLENLNGLDNLTALDVIDPLMPQLAIACNANLPSSEIEELTNRCITNGWNGCYLTKDTCPSHSDVQKIVDDSNFFFDDSSFHGWCSCNIWYECFWWASIMGRDVDDCKTPPVCYENGKDAVIYIP